MNPNGAKVVGVSVNRSSVHSFTRILATFYRNSIANISIHAGIVAHGTTLSHPVFYSPSYHFHHISSICHGIHSYRKRTIVPHSPRVLRPFYEEESEGERMIRVQIKASLVQCDRSLVKDFRSKLRGILVATKERRMIAFAFEIILSSSSHATPYSFSLNLHSKGDSFQEDFTLPTGTRNDGFALRGFFNSISWSSLTKNRESVTNFQWFPSL